VRDGDREIEVRQDSEFAMAVYDKLMADQDFTLVIHPATQTKVFERDDKVRVPFDDGMGDAYVESVGTNGHGRYVEVSYGHNRKYRTNLSEHSVVTTNVVNTPARIEVKRQPV
jgi:hypothetical protein